MDSQIDKRARILVCHSAKTSKGDRVASVASTAAEPLVRERPRENMIEGKISYSPA